VIAQSEINIAIGAKAPEKYFAELATQAKGEALKYGGINKPEEMRANFVTNCIPTGLLDSTPPKYEVFLQERRQLMALKIKEWFEQL
jgi:hypothetical protein